MNKKIFALALLATISLGFSSCKSKKSDEPVIPTPPNGPIQVEDDAANTNAALVLKLPAGTKVSINGTVHTAGSHGTIGVDNLPATLTLISNDLTEVSFKKAAPWVTHFTLRSQKVSADASSTQMDLSGLTGIKRLNLSGLSVPTLDLSKQVELDSLTLGMNGKNSSFKKITLPANNKITYFLSRTPLTNDDIDLSRFPALEYAMMISPYFTSVAFSNSPNLQTLAIDRPTAGQAFTLDLSANTKLEDLTLRDVHLTKLTIKNNQVLSTQKSNLVNVTADAHELDGMVEATKTWLIARILK